MNFKKVFFILAFFSSINLSAAEDAYVHEYHALQDTPRPKNHLRKIVCTAIAFAGLFALLKLVPEHEGPCQSTAFDDADNLLNTEWEVDLEGCGTHNNQAFLSPIYCPTNLTKMQLEEVVHKTLPYKPVNAMCVLKANATASNQTCVRYSPASLTQVAQNCTHFNNQKPKKQTRYQSPQLTAKKLMKRAKKKQNKKHMFNSGR